MDHVSENSRFWARYFEHLEGLFHSWFYGERGGEIGPGVFCFQEEKRGEMLLHGVNVVTNWLQFIKTKNELQVFTCKSLMLLVGRARFELATNGLKVRCSTG